MFFFGLAYILFKIFRFLSIGTAETLADELDFGNPSPLGLVAFICLIAAPLLRMKQAQP